MVVCQKCNTTNKDFSIFCVGCGVKLEEPKSEVQLLKEELLALQADYNEKFARLLSRIEAYELSRADCSATDSAVEAESETSGEEYSPLSVSPSESFVSSPADEVPEPVVEPVAEKKEIKATIPKKSLGTLDTAKPKKPIAEKKEPQPTPKSESLSVLDILRKIPVFNILLEELGSPFIAVWDYAAETYRTYKEKKQLPVFFMTLAGIAALLFGFGYLMQLSFSYFGRLSETVKVAFGFAVSIGISIWATKLRNKGVKYSSFSSALIGLSVALNYLFIYFLSNGDGVYHLFATPLIGFILIVANTVFASLFALRFETKVVAVLSLLGGAFAPFYLHSDGSSPFYFAYLWVLCAAAIYIGRKIRWQTMTGISFGTALSIVEIATLNGSSVFAQYTYAIIFHAFAYLFVWSSLFDNRTIKAVLGKGEVSVIAGALAMLMFNLYYLFGQTESYTVLGVIYLVNSFVFFPGSLLFKARMDRKMLLVMFIISGSFAAFAVPALVSTKLIGLCWSVEGLALFYLGFLFQMPNVRKEAFALLLIATGKMVLTFGNQWFVHGYLLTEGYFNLVLLGFIYLAAVLFFYRYKTELNGFETKLNSFLKELLPFWFAAVSVLTASYISLEWMSVLLIVPTLTVVFAGHYFKLQVSKNFGYSFFMANIFVAAVASVMLINTESPRDIFSVGFANFAGIGISLLSCYVLVSKMIDLYPDRFVKRKRYYFKLLSQIGSVWFSILFVVAGVTLVGQYVFPASILLLFGYLYIGNRCRLSVTENFAFLHFMLLIVGVVVSGVEAGSFQFLKQSFAGKMCMVEMLFTLWFLKAFYNKVLPGDPKIRLMDIVREVFFWIVPLLIISPVRRHYPAFLPEAVWVSAMISLGLLHFTKRNSLRVELTLLLIAGVVGVALSSHVFVSLPVSLACLFSIYFAYRGYDHSVFDKSEFKHIFLGMFYYVGACLFYLSYRWLGDLLDTSIVASAYFGAIALLKDRLAPLKNNYGIPYGIMVFVSGFAILFKLSTGGEEHVYLSLMPLVPFALSLFTRFTILDSRTDSLWLALVIIFNGLILMSAAIIVPLEWLTVLFVLHAIVVLFYSTKSYCSKLIWVAVALFGLAVAKLYFWDITHFTMTQKVFVFIGVGLLLLGASFLYVKLKERLDVAEVPVEE